MAIDFASLTAPIIMNDAFPTTFLNPRLLLLAIPALLLLRWITKRSFVKDNPRYDDDKSIRRRSKLRTAVFWTRALIVLLLIAVLATPLTRQTTLRPGDIHLTVLLDTSASMNTLDTSDVQALVDELRETLPVTVRTMDTNERSPLGDTLLQNLKPGENILLVTDGHVTHGQDLTSVLAFAAQMNSTVAALRLEPKITDAAVTIQGPAKAVADTNVTFTVTTSATEEGRVPLRITVDDVIIFEDSTSERTMTITRSFTQGRHRVTAEITTDDANTQNNRYDTIIWAVEKPTVLVVTQKDAAFIDLLKQLYTVTVTDRIPTTSEQLEPYYAVVLVDLPAPQITPATRALTDYLFAGNGLLVVGGPASYEYGGYRNAQFETLLPVTVGASASQGGITNIVLSLDMSSALEGSYVRQEDGTLQFQASDRPSLSRALAADVLRDLDPNHNVGAVVTGASAANVSQNIRDREYLYWDYIGSEQIGRVSTLGPKRDELEDAITRIRGGGQAPSPYWLAAPIKAMESVPGSKNVIVITDGMSCRTNCLASTGGSDEETTVNLARTIAAQGGRVYVVGVVPGRNEEFMTRVATAGNGIYFPASERNKLRILFGDPDQQDDGENAFSLITLNSNHFITRDVSLTATMYGYNEVVPKQYASLLVTAGNGQPALTVWNYGVGRVASLTTYNGEGYGELTARGNSLLMSRTGNWLVGDPERKQTTVLDVPQLYIGEEGTLSVRSSAIPENTALRFVPRGDDRYEATYTPTTLGFGEIGGIVYAASYPREYENVGQDSTLAESLRIANGDLFEVDDAQGIAEHVRTVRQLQETRLKPWRSPLLLLVAVLFIFEIAFRRIYEMLRSHSL